MPTLSEHLTALRMCGACGGDLRTAKVHPDGCVLCPECGAAWHRERFWPVDVAAIDPAALRALVKKGCLAKRGRLFTDKDGRVLEVDLITPQLWGRGRAPAGVEARFLKYFPGKVYGAIVMVFVALYMLHIARTLWNYKLYDIAPQDPNVLHWAFQGAITAVFLLCLLIGKFTLRMPIVKCEPGSNAGEPSAQGAATANG